MLERDVGNLRWSIDLFFDARKWLNFDKHFARLLAIIRKLSQPPIVLGYSRGGSAIAKLSKLVELKAAVLYESPVIDSKGVGGSFPVLMIWNDAGAATGPRAGQAEHSKATWKATHPVDELTGKGEHMKRRPPGHGWDCELNDQIRDWLIRHSSTERYNTAGANKE